MKYFEEPTDFIAYKENPRFKDTADRGEGEDRGDGPEPDGVEAIELGRVRLEEGVREIRDALDPRVPGPERGRSALRSHRRNGGQPRHAAAAGRGRQRPFREGRALAAAQQDGRRAGQPPAQTPCWLRRC